MTNRTLYMTPGSCSRVALNALEEIGLPYSEKIVELMRGAHRQPDYLAINPKGKIPVLDEDGVIFTELPVILYHLATVQPEARLLPTGPDGRPTLASLSDLIWLAGALHPLAGRLMRPTALSTIDPDGVKATALADFNGHAAGVSARLSQRLWWYGEEWSITDVLLSWVFATGGQFGFSYSDFKPLADHRARVEARPSFVRARAREIEIVERDQLAQPPNFKL